MDFVGTAKKITKAVVPHSILDPLWARYLAIKPGAGPSEPALDLSGYSYSENVEDFFTIEWLQRKVSGIGDPDLTRYFLTTPKDDLPSLCAPAADYRALIDSIIAVSRQSNYGIGTMVDGHRNIVADPELLSSELREKPFAQIRLLSREREFPFFIQRWEEEEGTLVAPLPNPVTRKIQLSHPLAATFFETPGRNLTALFSAPNAEECTFDVDVVYTWVNSEDPDWQALLAAHSPPAEATTEGGTGTAPSGHLDPDRYISRDELKYSLRSLLKFAPWVRHVYVVTNCKPPDWFDEANERVRWVRHEEIIDAEHLPTFSSHAIEASVHRVPNLAEHFLYFNDDLFVMRPVDKCDFFLANGLAKIRPEPYGIVHGSAVEGDPDYLNAARNGQALLQAEFGKVATRLHTHTPQSMRLSVVRKAEETFPEAFETTRSQKFRAISDISPTSFMYPSFAYLSGNAVMDFPKTALMNSNHPFEEWLENYTRQLNEDRYGDLPITLCINDGGGSTRNVGWGQAIVNFMQSSFDEPSEAERAV